MITFRGNYKGQDTVGLVISNENLVRLTNGQPILVNGAQVGLAHDLQIMIAYMEKDEFMQWAERSQAITKETNVIYKGKRISK